MTVAVVAFAVIREGSEDRVPSAASKGEAASLGVTDVDAAAVAALASGPTVSGDAARQAVIPILMYHVISAPPAGTPYPELWVAPAAFRAQMYALAARATAGSRSGRRSRPGRTGRRCPSGRS